MINFIVFRSIVSQRIGERSSIRIQRRISIRSGSTRSKRSEDYRPIRPEMRRVNNNIQEQIERMFTDVAKDATCTFPVRCLGALPLPEKVTSLQGLQEPLRQLYLSGAGIGVRISIKISTKILEFIMTNF